jgi:hypothetical protein
VGHARRRRHRPGPWPDIATAVSPTLPAHVQATGYDPDTGRLDLRPDSPAYATQLRLLTTRIIATANEHVGTQAVRALRVLPLIWAGMSRTEIGLL